MFPFKNGYLPILLLIIVSCSSFIGYSQNTEAIVSDNINQVVCRLVYLIEVTIGAIAALFIVVFGLQKMDLSNEGSRDNVHRKIAHVFIGLIIVIISMPIVNIVIASMLPGIECKISDLGEGGGPESNDPDGDPTIPDGSKRGIDDPQDGDSSSNKLPRAIAFVGLDEDPKKVSVKAAVDELVYFSGIESEDDDGVIISYSWNFGDGDSVEGLEWASADHRYSKQGTYTVSLRVTDDFGGTGECMVTVEVEESTSPIEGTDPEDETTPGGVVDPEGETGPDGVIDPDDETTPGGVVDPEGEDGPGGDTDPEEGDPTDTESPSSVDGSSRPLGGETGDDADDSSTTGDDGASSVTGGSRPLTGSDEELSTPGDDAP